MCGGAIVTLPQPTRDEFWTRAEALKVEHGAIAELRKGRRKASLSGRSCGFGHGISEVAIC